MLTRITDVMMAVAIVLAGLSLAAVGVSDIAKKIKTDDDKKVKLS